MLGNWDQEMRIPRGALRTWYIIRIITRYSRTRKVGKGGEWRREAKSDRKEERNIERGEKGERREREGRE